MHLTGSEPIITKEQAAPYLAALIDGEGCVYSGPVIPGTHRVHKRSIQIAVTEWDIIEAAASCCDHLGIRYTVTESRRQEPNRPVYTLMISARHNLQLVQDLVPIQLMRKRARLAQALASYIYPTGYTRVTEEEIRERMSRMRGTNGREKLDRHLAAVAS